MGHSSNVSFLVTNAKSLLDYSGCILLTQITESKKQYSVMN